jgi:predicted nucleic acid-binding protein
VIIYLDTSAALRAVVEAGASPEIEERIAAAEAILSSRLAIVESARVFYRLRLEAKLSGQHLDELERAVEELWSRSEIWELSMTICTAAAKVAPSIRLRTLDALHLATFQTARRRIVGLELVTADERLRLAAETL